MATTRRRTTKAASAPAARRGRPRKAAQSTAKTAEAPTKRDVTVYAEKAPTDYHKAFARYIVSEVGYDPDSAPSKRAAFLRGVSIATAARPAFMESDYLEQWRADNNVTKRGPKGGAAEEAPANRRTRRSTKAAPEPEVEDDEEFDEEDDDIEDDDDEEFEDDDEDSDEFDDDDDEEDDDEFEDEEDEVEEAPAPKRRGRPTKAATAKAAPAKRTAAKATTRRASKAADDEFLF